MAHVGILFCLYDHLKQLKEENIMAYMSEEVFVYTVKISLKHSPILFIGHYIAIN